MSTLLFQLELCKRGRGAETPSRSVVTAGETR